MRQIGINKAVIVSEHRTLTIHFRGRRWHCLFLQPFTWRALVPGMDKVSYLLFTPSLRVVDDVDCALRSPYRRSITQAGRSSRSVATPQLARTPQAQGYGGEEEQHGPVVLSPLSPPPAASLPPTHTY